PAVEDVALALDGHELADLELAIERVDVLKDFGVDLARHVLKDEHEEGTTAARPALLSAAEKEAGAGRGAVNRASLGKTSHASAMIACTRWPNSLPLRSSTCSRAFRRACTSGFSDRVAARPWPPTGTCLRCSAGPTRRRGIASGRSISIGSST